MACGLAAQAQQPQPATIDVTEQIKKLGELRDQGLLADQPNVANILGNLY